MNHLAELKKHRWMTVEARLTCEFELNDGDLFVTIRDGDRFVMSRRFLEYMTDLGRSVTYYSNDEEESYIAHFRNEKVTVFSSKPYARFDFYPVSKDG